MPITEPFLPMHLFKDFRGFTSLLIVASSAGIAFVGMHIIWPTRRCFLSLISGRYEEAQT